MLIFKQQQSGQQFIGWPLQRGARVTIIAENGFLSWFQTLAFGKPPVIITACLGTLSNIEMAKGSSARDLKRLHSVWENQNSNHKPWKSATMPRGRYSQFEFGSDEGRLNIIWRLCYNYISIGGGGSRDNFSGLNFREDAEEKSHKAYKHPEAAISSAERWELSSLLVERHLNLRLCSW